MQILKKNDLFKMLDLYFISLIDCSACIFSIKTVPRKIRVLIGGLNNFTLSIYT